MKLNMESAEFALGLQETIAETIRRSGWQLGSPLDELTAPIASEVLSTIRDFEGEPEPESTLQGASQQRVLLRQAVQLLISSLTKEMKKTERGLPNEIAHDQGWDGALELAIDRIQRDLLS